MRHSQYSNWFYWIQYVNIHLPAHGSADPWLWAAPAWIPPSHIVERLAELLQLWTSRISFALFASLSCDFRWQVFSATKRTSEFQIIDTVQDWQHSPLIHTQSGNDIQVGRPSESSWVPPSKRISNTPHHFIDQLPSVYLCRICMMSLKGSAGFMVLLSQVLALHVELGDFCI